MPATGFAALRGETACSFVRELCPRQRTRERKTLSVFGKDGQLLAVYPASIGSADKPAPSGTLKVTNIARNPTYKYNPKYAFKEIKTDRPFTIKPGPTTRSAWCGSISRAKATASTARRNRHG